MKASEINLNRFLAQSDTQFIIPVYQRNYNWTKIQCKQLINDILEIGINKKESAHFIGSIVYVHDDVYSASGIRELTIIDGQQRLTTITLLYLVLYRIAKEILDNQLLNRINEQYLINKFDNDEGSKLKLRPTEPMLSHVLELAEEGKSKHEILAHFPEAQDKINKQLF